MAIKQVITFKRSDAPKPTKAANGTIVLRSPFPFTIKPQATVTVNFGLQCNHALVVAYCEGEPSKYVFLANKPITATIKNESFSDDLVYDVGTAVLYVSPLATSEYEIE